jgi:hypothetical protein
MARASCRVLLCVILSAALAGCAKLVETGGTETSAKTRVKFILQTIKNDGSGSDTVIQTAICRFRCDKVYISDSNEQALATDAFDEWRQKGGIYPTLQTFAVDEKVGERLATDPEGTFYVSATIDGVKHRLRVPQKAQISWADEGAEAQGGTAKPVIITETEVQRKKAEWDEHVRMNEQSQADLQAWRRSRVPTEQPLPRVGAAQAGPRVGGAQAGPRVGAAQADPRANAGQGGTSAEEQLSLALRAWHRRYSQRSTAVSLALSQYAMAARESPPDMPRLLAACRSLRAASQGLLADPQALSAPLATVSGPLTTAYREIEATAFACLAARSDEQATHLASARRAMAEAGEALRPFRLAP